jgi:hypothetical protein
MTRNRDRAILEMINEAGRFGVREEILLRVVRILKRRTDVRRPDRREDAEDVSELRREMPGLSKGHAPKHCRADPDGWSVADRPETDSESDR